MSSMSLLEDLGGLVRFFSFSPGTGRASSCGRMVHATKGTGSMTRRVEAERPKMTWARGSWAYSSRSPGAGGKFGARQAPAVELLGVNNVPFHARSPSRALSHPTFWVRVPP